MRTINRKRFTGACSGVSFVQSKQDTSDRKRGLSDEIASNNNQVSGSFSYEKFIANRAHRVLLSDKIILQVLQCSLFLFERPRIRGLITYISREPLHCTVATAFNWNKVSAMLSPKFASIYILIEFTQPLDTRALTQPSFSSSSSSFARNICSFASYRGVWIIWSSSQSSNDSFKCQGAECKHRWLMISSQTSWN